jgi:hypothetical protein
VAFDSSKGWPNGIKPLGNTSYGVYFDVKVTGKNIGMKPAKSNGDGDGGDRNFKKLDTYKELFITDENNNVYVSSDFKIPEGIEKAEVISDELIKLTFSTEKFDENQLSIKDKKGNILYYNFQESDAIGNILNWANANEGFNYTGVQAKPEEYPTSPAPDGVQDNCLQRQ